MAKFEVAIRVFAVLEAANTKRAEAIAQDVLNESLQHIDDHRVISWSSDDVSTLPWEDDDV